MTAPNLNDPVTRVLEKLKGVKSHGSYWTAKCPGHDDKKESLSVKKGGDGRVLLNCFAGCTFVTIIGAMGMTAAETFATPLKVESGGADPRKVHDLGKPVAHYKYHDANGNVVYKVVRFEPKDFRPYRPENGRWVVGLGNVQPLLYNLPAVIEAVALKKRIFLCEGEKDADNLTQLGYVATTNSGGAKKWEESFTKVLAGADVVIFEDNDQAGKDRSAQLCPELHAAGCTVRSVRLPNLPPKGDVSDFITSGDNTLDAMEEAITNTPYYAPAGTRRVKWKLSEIWNNEFIMRPPPAVVPRLAWAGRSTLLAAREKSGKSTLIGYIASRVSQGEQFLDEFCVKGDVLVIGLEEYLGDVARRLKHFGADGDRVTLVDGFLGDAIARPSEIKQHIEDLCPVLVVVDSLVAFANGRGIDENDAAMATVVQPLTDMAHATGTALIIVHHASKGSGKARGSTSIMGATDVVCEFFAPDEDADPTNRRMRSVGRVPLIRQYDMRFDGNTYSLAEGLEGPIEARVVKIVGERPGISSSDLAAAIGGQRERALTTVRAMLASGVLVNRSDSVSRPKLHVASPVFL